MRRRNMSYRKIAQGASVPEARVKLWCDQEDTPTKQEFGRLCQHLGVMHQHRPATFATKVSLVAAKAPAERAAELAALDDARALLRVVPERPPRAKTFGEALLREREAESLSQDELGAIVEVTGQAVSHWETERTAPVRAHYDALLGLFPRLRDEPEPDWRNIDPPDDGTAWVPEIRAAPEATPAPTPIAVGPAERLLSSYGEVRGGAWTLTVSVTLDGPDGAREAATGASVEACCDALMGRLREAVDDRLRALEAQARTLEALRRSLGGGR
jgi:transcriptional regulator with XRE-family HTH domain